MTYTKDPNITYTEMAIYIDNTVYSDNRDDDKIFQYCYQLCHMLGRNARYFKDYDILDKYAVFMATQIYLRLTNVKQFELDNNGVPKLEKVKSVLNYCKKTQYQYKVQFEKEHYAQSISEESYDIQPEFNFDNSLRSYIDRLNFCEFNLTFDNIDRTCKSFLSTIPYKKDTADWLNIYASVMLTFLNDITFSRKQLERIEHLKSTDRYRDYHMSGFYAELNNQKPVLYHLPAHMSNYIKVLTRELKHIIAEDLQQILHTKVSTDLSETITYSKLNQLGDDDEN